MTDKQLSAEKVFSFIDKNPWFPYQGSGYVQISELKRAINSGELDSNGWVSVDERLPEPGEIVDIWHRESKWYPEGFRIVNVSYLTDNPSKIGWYDDSVNFYKPDDIVFWMSPQAPKR